MGTSDADRNARSGRNGRSGSSAAVAVAGVQLAVRDWGSGEPMVALDEFLSVDIGPRWREVTERHIAGSAAQMNRTLRRSSTRTCLRCCAGQFGPADVGRISCPVMHVSGIDSGPWFAEVRNLMLEWFPHADDAVIEGADSLALTHSHAIAPAIATFMRDNPMGHDGN